MAVLELALPRKLPADCASTLRELADRIDRNEIDSMVLACNAGDDRIFMWPSSLYDSMILAVMIHAQAADRLRA